MLNLFLPFLYKIAPLVKSCGDQWPEQQLQVSNYFSMAGGQERNLKIEESLPLGTTKDMVQGSVKISVRLSGQSLELQFLLPFANSYELPDIF